MRRTASGVLAALVLLLTVLSTPAGALTTVPPPPGPTTTVPPPAAYILIDADTGAVLAKSSDRTPRRPASLTKVLTALAAAASLPQNSTLKISARAAAQPENKVGAKTGETWPTDDAMHVLLMESANDLAMAFAEAVGGSAEGFQAVMTRTAKSIGMTDPQTWRDPAGLDDEASVGGGNLVSARDLAIAGRSLIAHPWLSPISATPRFRFTMPSGAVHETVNHNKLVLGRYPGAIGGKTGYTKKAGNSLLAAARRNGRTMLSVVLDSKDTYGFTTQLLDRGFATSVRSQQRLERLPALRLPAPAPTAPTTTASTAAPTTATTAAPTTTLSPTTTATPEPLEQLDQAVELLTISPDPPGLVAPEPTPVLSQIRAGDVPQRSWILPAAATGAIGCGTILLGFRGVARRRRRRSGSAASQEDVHTVP